MALLYCPSNSSSDGALRDLSKLRALMQQLWFILMNSQSQASFWLNISFRKPRLKPSSFSALYCTLLETFTSYKRFEGTRC